VVGTENWKTKSSLHSIPGSMEKDQGNSLALHLSLQTLHFDRCPVWMYTVLCQPKLGQSHLRVWLCRCDERKET
jgi:hypothetical protein